MSIEVPFDNEKEDEKPVRQREVVLEKKVPYVTTRKNPGGTPIIGVLPPPSPILKNSK